MTQAGTIVGGPAWSTIKVPLAVAALGQPGAGHLAEQAITVSDNDAARALGPARAARGRRRGGRVRPRSCGRSETRVQTEVVHPPYMSFGQTEWTLAAQQRFAAGLSAVPGAEAVLDLMRRIVPEQRWGFGAVAPDAAFKGGWGPDDRHLVRQFAIFELSGRTVAAAIANEPADGTYERAPPT